jgi:hypothetical protein
MRRIWVSASVAVLVGSLGLGSRVSAQLHGSALEGFSATCTVLQGGNQVTVEVRAFNGSSVDLTGLTASSLNVDATGNAAFSIVSVPTMRRVLIRNNAHSFKWQGSLSGAGTLTLSTDVTAETPSGVTVTTGTVTCNPITVSAVPTDTPRLRATPEPTRTPASTKTPRARATVKPTRTAAPTNTPRVLLTRPPTQTPHIRPTRTPAGLRPPKEPNPTHTPVPPKATRTPVPPTEPPTVGELSSACFLTQNGNSVTISLLISNTTGVELADVTPLDPQVTSTGSALLNLGSAVPGRFSSVASGNNARFRWQGDQSGSGQSRVTVGARMTANGQVIETQAECDPITTAELPTNTPIPAPATRTPRIPEPTKTAVPAEATRTPRVPEPTKTPVPPGPTRTVAPPEPINPAGFTASCHTMQSGANVGIFLTVNNGTGAGVTNVRAHGPTITASDTASLNITNGPSPGAYASVADRTKASFKWGGQLSGAGNVSITASATARGAGGEELDTGEVDCGTVGQEAPPPPPFDASKLIGLCEATVVDGKILASFRLLIINGTGGDLTNMTPFGPDIETTGTATLSINNGPNPDSVGTLRDGGRTRFRWQGQGSGKGNAFIHVGVTATGPNGEALNTGPIECNTLVLPPKPRG